MLKSLLILSISLWISVALAQDNIEAIVLRYNEPERYDHKCTQENFATATVLIYMYNQL